MRTLIVSAATLAALTVGAPGGLAAEPITLVAAGDLLLGGSAAPLLEREGFDYPFGATRTWLTEADLAVANLEAPLTGSDDEFVEKTYRFKVPPVAAAALGRAGFDVLTLANNHIVDFGPAGIAETLAALDAAGLSGVGAGSNLTEARRSVILEVKDQKVAFLAYSNTFPEAFWAGKDRAGTAPGWPGLVSRDVRRARQAADYVVVSFHWSSELMTQPKDYQRDLARLAIDNGAQVVLGHHPHVLQGVEHYRDGVVYYSLGNFAFGSYSKNSRTSALARITLEEGVVSRAEILPLNVYNTEVAFRPQPLTRDANLAFALEFSKLCAPLSSALEPRCELFWNVVPTSFP